MMRCIGLLGFGAVGSALASGVLRNSEVEVLVYDPALTATPGVKSRDLPVGVKVVESVSDLGGSDFILSVVTPAAALAVAESYSPSVRAGQMYIDLNSTNPQTKHDGAALVEGAGGVYVDGVLTGGGIALDGFAIPILLSGPAADAADALLRSFGMRSSVVGSAIGQAAATKMLRGVVLKGMEALFVEAFVAAHEYGVGDAVLDTIAETLDSWPAHDLVGALLSTHIRHCGRRSIEVDMISSFVSEIGLQPIMTEATSRVFSRSAGLEMVPVAGSPDDLIGRSAVELARALSGTE
jgi:3-hydroxyisobutyrate dehydrogenase-like beta-hydroxyacid dehydrogenase